MKFCGFNCVLIFVLYLCIPINTLETSPYYQNDSDILEIWMKMDKNLKDSVQSLIKQLMPKVIRSSGRVNLTSSCMKDTLQLISGLRNLKSWAVNFVDSSAKLLDGALSNTITNFGDYDQCIETVVPNSKRNDPILFRGQYCKVELSPPLPPKTKTYKLFDRLEELRNFSGTEVIKEISTRAHFFYFVPITLGVCIPSSCTKDDFNQILTVAAEDLYLNAKVQRCEIKEETTEFKNIQIFVIFLVCLLVSFTILGTLIELFSDEKNRKSYPFLRCFSVINNFKKIISTKSAGRNFRCIHGIRFLSITWVVYGHSYLYPGYYKSYYRALLHAQDVAAEPFAQTIMNSSMVVDTFLFMSGLLVCFLTIKHVKLDKKPFNFVQFVIHRLWRIAPVYYFIILFVFLVPLMGSGPVFKDVMEKTINPCFQVWWKNLLFINNFNGMENTCMWHTWYVAADVQLYLASLLVLVPLFKSEKIGIAINVLIILASVLYTITMTHLMDHPGYTAMIVFIDPVDFDHGFKYIYANTLTRAGPYFIGVLVGYILVTRPNLKISKTMQAVGWCLATVSTTLVLYCTAIWFHLHFPSRIEILLYAGFYNVAFTAGIAWMTFCCISGRGGFINHILSWKLWVPLGKLTFTIFLIEPVFQTAYISLFRSPQEFTHMHFIVEAFGFICISAFLALIVNLLVESPFLALEKLLLHKKPKTVAATNVVAPSIEKDNGVANGNPPMVLIDLPPNYTPCYMNESKENQAFDKVE